MSNPTPTTPSLVQQIAGKVLGAALAYAVANKPEIISRAAAATNVVVPAIVADVEKAIPTTGLFALVAPEVKAALTAEQANIESQVANSEGAVFDYLVAAAQNEVNVLTGAAS